MPGHVVLAREGGRIDALGDVYDVYEHPYRKDK